MSALDSFDRKTMIARIAPVVREIVADVLDHRLTREVAVARGVERLEAVIESEGLPAHMTPRERLSTHRDTRRSQMRAEMIRLEREGRGRAAAMLVARKFAHDPLDPTELASMARSLRRWRRKKNGQCPVAVEIEE